MLEIAFLKIGGKLKLILDAYGQQAFSVEQTISFELHEFKSCVVLQMFTVAPQKNSGKAAKQRKKIPSLIRDQLEMRKTI